MALLFIIYDQKTIAFTKKVFSIHILTEIPANQHRLNCQFYSKLAAWLVSQLDTHMEKNLFNKSDRVLVLDNEKQSPLVSGIS